MELILKRALASFSLAVVIIGCNRPIEKQNLQAGNKEDNVSNKKDYELADKFLLELKKNGVDTIIYYKRTCISCCDFYNIFWSSKRQGYLAKFYFDFNDMKTHSKIITMKSNKIFKVLESNYNELKSSSIEGNSHKQKDGTLILTVIDHYCYAQMDIYTAQDSIITGRIKDHDFDKFTDFGDTLPGKKRKRETNDNYETNLNSKWNILLTTIEKEISNMIETSSREFEVLRTINSKK